MDIVNLGIRAVTDIGIRDIFGNGHWELGIWAVTDIGIRDIFGNGHWDFSLGLH